MIWTLAQEPAYDRREILAYMRSGGGLPDSLLDGCLETCRGLMKREVLYSLYPVRFRGDETDLGFASVRSRDLARALSGCTCAVLFAATAGFAFDREIARARVTSPLLALAYHAIGAERVEALCDAFCDFIAREAAGRGLKTRPRYSPGYGDLPLSLQAEIASALGMEKLGIILESSMLMRPSKSVTALIGLYPESGSDNGGGADG